jgi:hypothetical protein
VRVFHDPPRRHACAARSSCRISRGPPTGGSASHIPASQDLGFVGDPEQLIGGELGAVGGVGQPSFGEQILEADGDDH